MSDEITQKLNEKPKDKPQELNDSDISSDMNQIPILSYDQELMDDFDESLLEGEEAIIDFVEEEESIDNEIDDVVGEPDAILDDDSYHDESDFLSSSKDLDDIVNEIENEIDEEFGLTDPLDVMDFRNDENKVIETENEEMNGVQVVEMPENEIVIEETIDIEQDPREDHLYTVEGIEDQDIEEDEDLEVFTNFDTVEPSGQSKGTSLNSLVDSTLSSDHGPEDGSLVDDKDPIILQVDDETLGKKEELDLVLIIDIDEEQNGIGIDTASLDQSHSDHQPVDTRNLQGAENDSDLIDSLDELSEEIISEDDILGGIDETLKEAWGFQDEEDLEFSDDLFENTKEIEINEDIFSSSEIEVPILPGEEVLIEEANGPWELEEEGLDKSQGDSDINRDVENTVVIDEVEKETHDDLIVNDGLDQEIENIMGMDESEGDNSDVLNVNDEIVTSSIDTEIEEEYFELAAQDSHEESNTPAAISPDSVDTDKEDEQRISTDEPSMHDTLETPPEESRLEGEDGIINLTDLESEITINTDHQEVELTDRQSSQETERGEEHHELENPLPDQQNEEVELSATEKISPNGEGMSFQQKEEIKEILKYIDTLFGDLPSERVKEFARSKYYELYNKIFDDLGI